MKTKEFIKKVEALGFEVSNWGDVIRIFENDWFVAMVVTNDMYLLNTDFSSYYSLDEEIKKELFDLISEYVKTPIDEREEPRKYYLRYKWINADYNYLNYDRRIDVFSIDRILNFNWIKGKFTLEEIDEIKEKYDTKLEDFEIVEVEE